jgi:branched-chain amino acid transport system permease protein
MDFFVTQLLNSISYGALLFMIASGFSLIFGLMKIVNLVHVAYFTAGGYIGYWIYGLTGSFLLAVLGAALAICIIGAFVFKFLLYRLQGNPQRQVLLCLGLIFVFDDGLMAIFGGYPKIMETPAFMAGTLSIGGAMFPISRMFVLLAGIVVMLALEFLVHRTRVGAMVRSGVDDEETTRAMGVNVDLLFILVYLLGAFLAAFGGVLGAGFLGLASNMSFSYLPLSLAIVIIGGMGNLKGAFYGSMLIATLSTFGQSLLPALSYFTTYLPVVLILVFKPNGLLSGNVKFGRKVKNV